MKKGREIATRMAVVVFTMFFTMAMIGAPNLIPYQPAGWSDKIVVARTTGTTTDSTALITSDSLYVNWAVINNGNTAATNTFYTYLYVDGVYQTDWFSSPPLNANFYVSVNDYSIGSLSAGTHTITLTTDATGAIVESNETDNSFTKTITVNNPPRPNLTPYQPSGWSDKIVVSRNTGTTTDSTALTPADSLYIDWAVVNNGAVAVTNTFYTYLYLDGVFKNSWFSNPPLNVSNFVQVNDYPIGLLSAGTHTITITTDATGAVAESNGADNSYTKTISIQNAWAPLAHAAPGAVNLMLLLSDGTVMCANNDDYTFGNAWYRLTPDNHGSYVNGTWSNLAAMQDTRLFYSSQVLKDGRVFVAGGEYGTGKAKSEVYNPVNDIWTQIPVPLALLNPNQPSPVLQNGNQKFFDSGSEILSNGNVLVAPVGPNTNGGTLIYNPASNTWTAGPLLVSADYQDEASWVKLPDESILTVDPASTRSERYIPALNQWIHDANVPVSLYDTNQEIGAALLLPDGRAFFLGATGQTVFYTPTGNTNHGAWTVGPNIPDELIPADAPAAMMANGKVLCAFSSAYSAPPTYFYEFDPASNSFSPVGSPTGGSSDNIASYGALMLDLPDGNVLYSQFGSNLFIYQPAGSPTASGKPTITGITQNPDGSYHLTGTKLNGISEGAAYGDDAQMNSNYPLVRLTDGSGNVRYLRTYNWSSTGVMTGNTPVTTEFTNSAALAFGAYSLVVVANGISSDPVSFTLSAYQPTIVFTRQATNLILSWPTNAVGFTLESALSLSPTNWAIFSPAPTMSGTQYVTTNLMSGTKKFFRLKKP